MPFRLPWKKKSEAPVRKAVADITKLRTQLSRKNPDYKSRAQAAEKLGHTNNLSAIIPLNTSLTNDRSPVVKIAAAKSLAKLNSKEATVSLGKALNREIKKEKLDPIVVTQIVLALGRTKHNHELYLRKAEKYAKEKGLWNYKSPEMSIGDAITIALQKVI